MAEGERKGREEGFAEGRKEGEIARNIAIVGNMLAQGLAIETISQCVVLSIEELNATNAVQIAELLIEKGFLPK